jgi:hypothetical protein
MPQHGFLISIVAAALITLHSTSEAVALRPNKSTDNTVCDLSHNTNGFIGRTVLIPGDAPYKDQVDAFFRIAATFVVSKCANGQLLILQGSSSVSVDRPSLAETANSACTAAGVSQTDMSVPSMIPGEVEPAFELRCVISKREELAAKLAAMEQADPLDSLKARLQAAARSSTGQGASASSSDKNKDCSKMTLASLLQGGACKK